MHFPAPYLDFLYHFHGDRDYFECHEVLEDHWKDSGMERDSIWVGLIQVAVTFYHYRRGNLKGALKMIDKALFHLDDKQGELYSLGIKFSVIIDDLTKLRSKIISNQPYKPYYFPIFNPTLLHVCETRCEEGGFAWGTTPKSVSDTIVNRHLTRDRSEVIEERSRALADKNASRRLVLTSS